MLRKSTIALLAGAALALPAGCAKLNYGHSVSQANVGKLQPGRTTKQDVYGLLGQPAKEVREGEREILFYPAFNKKGAAEEFYVTIENGVVLTYTERK